MGEANDNLDKLSLAANLSRNAQPPQVVTPPLPL